MKTLCTDCENININFGDKHFLLSLGTEARKLATDGFKGAFGQFKISESAAKHFLMLISKAAIKELLGADMDVKLVVMLFAGYLSLIKQSIYLLQAWAFKRRSEPHFHQHELTYN